MKENIYEGVVGNYSFQMVDNLTIEVWSDTNLEHPDSYIFLKEGDVKTEKDFHYEVMLYASKNLI